MKQAWILAVMAAVVVLAGQAPAAEKGESRPAGKAAAAKRAQKPAVKKAEPGPRDDAESSSFDGNETEVEVLSGNKPELLSGN